MRGFPGFPDGRLEFTPVPEMFFSDLLPLIDDLFELKVTLYCLWLIQQKKGEFRHITLSELAQDEVLLRGLQAADCDAQEALRQGLERSVARGTLLQVSVRQPGQADQTWYLVNSEHGRMLMERIGRGEQVPSEVEGPVRLQAHRPNIFVLYEQNVGLLQPLLAEELMEAERTYPPEWIEEAFRIAVSQNVRRWAYIRGILERWANEGRSPRGGREPRGPYADLINR